MKVALWVAFFLMLLIPLAWFFADAPATKVLQPILQETPPIFLGVIPYLQPEKLREQMEPIYSYLSKKLGRPVLMTTVTDYESLGRLVELKKVHIAWFSHASYERLRGNRPWQVLCRPVQYGSFLYTGQIIVRADAPYQQVEDLNGRSFAYVDRYSGSGFYFPNILFEKKGIRPLDFFKSVHFTQSHRNSIVGVLNRTYDAAAVFSASLLTDSDEELRVIAKTGPIPNDPLVIHQDLEPDLKKAIEKAMLEMHTDPDGQKHLQTLLKLRGTEKFVPEAEVQKSLADNSL